MKLKEVDLYEPVKKWLEEKGHKVYSEVSPKGATSRVDVVGIDSDHTVIVEMKLNLSISLLEQAVKWQRYGFANHIYIAVPWNKKDTVHRYGTTKNNPDMNSWIITHILKEFGIGLLFVNVTKQYGKDYYVYDTPYIEAKLHTIKNKGIRNTIEKYQYEFDNSELVAGTNGGGYITDYRVTMDKIKELLEKSKTKKPFSLWWYKENKRTIDLKEVCTNGWLDLDTILTYCKTHWSSPRKSLTKALREFESHWCETKVIKNKRYFKVKTETKIRGKRSVKGIYVD